MGFFRWQYKPSLLFVNEAYKKDGNYDALQQYTEPILTYLETLTNDDLAEILKVDPKLLYEICGGNSTNNFFGCGKYFGHYVVDAILYRLNCEPDYLKTLDKSQKLYALGLKKLMHIFFYVRPDYFNLKKVDSLEIDRSRKAIHTNWN